ncbi:MAG: hypothetical protein OXE56_06705 [Gammaproteobacteria bacterium]|nr:hypothetical protein [Gammaproteobacteria bacterium]
MENTQTHRSHAKQSARRLESIDDLKVLTGRKDIDRCQPGTSHVPFNYSSIAPLTVPAHKPVKAVYIKRFLELMTLTGKMIWMTFGILKCVCWMRQKVVGT